MAIEGRTEVTQTVSDNIYDNNAKEIDPAKVRAALASLIESYFNLKDDELHSLNYQGGSPLSSFISPPLWGSTGYFDVGGPGGPVPGSEGIIGTVRTTQLGRNDTEVSIDFNQNINERKLLISIHTNSTAMDQSNDVGSPVIRVVNATSIRVGLREIAQTNQNIRLEIFAFKI